VTKPVALTVAMDVLLDIHVTDWLAFGGVTVADNCCVLPLPISVKPDALVIVTL
jgi:hypothetical protein